MTTEQFIEERQQLNENLRVLLSDHLDLWSVDDTAQEDHLVLSRLVGEQKVGNHAILHIDYAYTGGVNIVKVTIDGVDISLSSSSSENLVILMKMFKQRWDRRAQDAEQEKESKAIQALAVAMTVTRISAGCKITNTPTEG